jgi:hypothetical protein
VSALGQTFVIPESSLASVAAAAKPRKRLLGGPVDEFWDVLRRESSDRIEYGWDGYVLATLLPYLAEQGIDLMNSEHDQAGTEISMSRDATAFVLTPVHREKYLLRLDPDRFDEATLQRYYEGFNQTDGTGVGPAMLDGIGFFRDGLAALNGSTVGLFIIA